MTLRSRLAALAGCAAALVVPSAAHAAPPTLSDFVLKPGAVGLPAQVAALDKTLRPSGVQAILDQANRVATSGGSCGSSALHGVAGVRDRFCFNASDTGRIGGDGSVEWIPQGVTTVADAQADQQWGARQAILVSWYDKRTAPAKGVRITFLNPATHRYRHVLLVYPYRNSKGNPSYGIVGVHAGGIVWYGNYLYVVDTARGIRIFDMRHIYDLQASPNGNATSKTKVGRQHGVYYGFGYRYVMPQVGAWVNAGADYHGGFHCPASGPSAFSYVSLDRSTVPDRLITGSYCSSGDPGRVAAWPLNGAPGHGELLASGDGRVHATEALRLPTNQIQGAVAANGTWYLSRSRGASTPGRLVTARPSNGVLQITGTRPAGIGPEDLSFWPGRNELWTVTEHAGRRVLYGVTP